MIDTSTMTPATSLSSGESEVGLDLLELADEALRYLESFPWCLAVKELYYDRGFPKVALFYARIEPTEVADSELWVVVGDVPPLYLDTMVTTNGAEALLAYAFAYDDVVDLYRRGEPLDDAPPVVARESLRPLEMNDELAKMLKGRIQFISKMIMELWEDELSDEAKELMQFAFG